MNVSPNDKITRFINENSKLSIKENRVKPRAFYPTGNSIDVSVFITTGLLDKEVWDIGIKNTKV